MDFSFSEEQGMLQDSVQRFIQNSYPFDARQKMLKTDDGFSRENWSSFAELGWLALPFSEENGGFGGTAVETMIMMEEFGKGLVVEPFVSTVIMAGSVIEAGGTAEHKQGVLAEIMAGTHMSALAYVEPQARFNLANVTTTATSSGDGFVINGFKGVVLGGPSANSLVVPARTSGDQQDESGITLFLVDAASNGVSKRNYPTIDGLQASEIMFENVEVSAGSVLGEVGEGLKLLELGIDSGILAVGAEAVGAMEVLYKTTVEYCKTRQQFGQPIGKFQVLQHRMVDMFMEHEQAKSLLYMAALRLSEDDAVEAKKAVSALKVQIGKGGRFVGQNAIQLHGGMGMTDELNVGHYFKRLTAIETLFGNADHHLKKYARVA
ncbi:MAG: alkylation response protein AidB-like acyl-CoA dehydrogenase [Candidatus Azotimanducaceae bacterium]|jgi:alkylation response protein AidB-like acyl-CoA dehydrogenase